MTKVADFTKGAARGFAWNHLYKLVEYGLMNLYTVLVVRKFGPELAAPFAVYLSIVVTLQTLGAFGVDGVLLRYLPRILHGAVLQHSDAETPQDLRGFIRRMFGFRLYVLLSLAVIVAFMLGVLPLMSTSVEAWLGTLPRLTPLIIAFLLAQGIVAFCTFTLIGLLRIKYVFFASLISRMLLLSAGILLVSSSTLTLDSAVSLHVVAALLNALLLLYWMKREVFDKTDGTDVEPREAAQQTLRGKSSVRQAGGFLRSPKRVKIFLATPFMLYGLTTWGSDLLSTVLGRQPDILMMRAMLGEHSVQISFYQAACTIVLMTEYLFLFGLGGPLVSVFSSMAHRDEEEHTKSNRTYPRLLRARKQVASYQTVATAPLFVFMFAFSPLVVELIFGVRYLPAVPLVRCGILFLSTVVIVFGGGMQITGLIAIGKERLVFRNRVYCGIANLIMNYFLIRAYGGLGAIFGTQLCNGAANVLEWYYAKKLIGSPMDYPRSALILSISGAAVAAAYFSVDLLIGGSPIWVQLGLAAVITTVLVTAAYFGFKLPEARAVLDRAKQMLAGQKSITPIEAAQ